MYVPDRQIDESRKYKNHRKLSGQGGVHWWEWLLTVAALHVLYPTSYALSREDNGGSRSSCLVLCNL